MNCLVLFREIKIKNQIQVIVNDLNVRKGAGSNNEITFFPLHSRNL